MDFFRFKVCYYTSKEGLRGTILVKTVHQVPLSMP